MRTNGWIKAFLGPLTGFCLICETFQAHAEGRYLALAGPDGFFFMLDRMSGGFKVCPVLGGQIGPGGCSQGLNPVVTSTNGDVTRFAMHYSPKGDTVVVTDTETGISWSCDFANGCQQLALKWQ